MLGGLLAGLRARRHILVRPDMDDLVQRPDLGVPKGGERRQLGAVRQRFGKALLELGRRAGVQRIGAKFDNHRGSSLGVRDPDASPLQTPGQGLPLFAMTSQNPRGRICSGHPRSRRAKRATKLPRRGGRELNCHCEERSDEAIPFGLCTMGGRLVRFARNDREALRALRAFVVNPINSGAQ